MKWVWSIFKWDSYQKILFSSFTYDLYCIQQPGCHGEAFHVIQGYKKKCFNSYLNQRRHDRDRMVVGFTTTCTCNQCLSPLKLWVQIPLRRGVLDVTLCDKVWQWLVAGQWFSLVFPTNKTDSYDITEILLKMALNTVTLVLTPSILLNHI